MNAEALTDILRSYIDDAEVLQLAVSEIMQAQARERWTKQTDKAQSLANSAERLVRSSHTDEGAVVRALLALYHQREAEA